MARRSSLFRQTASLRPRLLCLNGGYQFRAVLPTVFDCLARFISAANSRLLDLRPFQAANGGTMSSAPLNNTNAIGRCQLCGSMRQTARVKFERNIGMLVLRQTRRLEAQMCKT